MPRATKGHIGRLLSGSFRVSVYAGIDPLARRRIRLRSTVKDELQAQIELGRLLKEASEGRTPETDAAMARLMDEYAPDRRMGHIYAKPGAVPGQRSIEREIGRGSRG